MLMAQKVYKRIRLPYTKKAANVLNLCTFVFVIRDSFSMCSMLKQTVSCSYLWASKGPVCMQVGDTR